MVKKNELKAIRVVELLAFFVTFFGDEKKVREKIEKSNLISEESKDVYEESILISERSKDASEWSILKSF